MKKFATTLCIVGTAMTLSACGSTGMGDVDTAPPYATERTASHENGQATMHKKKVHHADAPAADRVFKEYQTK